MKLLLSVWGGIWNNWWDKDEDEEACAHSYESVVTTPSCVDKGYTTHTCSECGYSYKDSYTNAKGHDWDDGEITKAPTCTKNGVKTYVCETCDAERTDCIQANGHDYEDGICIDCGAKKPIKNWFYGWFGWFWNFF